MSCSQHFLFVTRPELPASHSYGVTKRRLRLARAKVNGAREFACLVVRMRKPRSGVMSLAGIDHQTKTRFLKECQS